MKNLGRICCGWCGRERKERRRRERERRENEEKGRERKKGE